MCQQMCGTSGRTTRDRRAADEAARRACERRGGETVEATDYRATAERLRRSAAAVTRHGDRVEAARLALIAHASVCDDLADALELPTLFDLAG